MSVSEVSNLVEVVAEEEVISTDEILNRLVALGVNHSHRSYGNEHKELCDAYFSCNLSTIANSWDMLEDAVKVKVVDKHSDEFKAWIGGR